MYMILRLLEKEIPYKEATRHIRGFSDSAIDVQSNKYIFYGVCFDVIKIKSCISYCNGHKTILAKAC